jgi:outer membrane protein assembly factor BamE (lipoprotein component of BamABCDE complex)
MKKAFIALFASCLLLASQAQAFSDADQYNIDQMVNGGPVSIRNAAKNLYHTQETKTEVLDVMAEVLLQNYHLNDRNGIDAMSWASKALGNSGLGRYRSTLEEVAENGAHRKLRKYAKKSLKQLSDDGSAQYVKGSVDLNKLRENPKAAGSSKKAASKKTTQKKAAAPAPAAAGKAKPITEVKVGMSMAQAYAIAGQPTATTTYQTGKAWIPFNFKGGDTARQAALYKGQGRIVFSNESHYSGNWRVLEVLVNPNESGYP